GAERTVTVAVGPIPGDASGAIGLGILVAQVVGELPIEIELSGLGEIGGPSAGLVLALAIHDLLSPEDIVARRTIAITGTLNAEGQVGNVGGIRHKVISAEAIGATLMLVPSGQLDAAPSQSSTDMRIVGVDTFDEALEVLRRR